MPSFLRIWSRLLKKPLMENFSFCTVFFANVNPIKQDAFHEIYSLSPGLSLHMEVNNILDLMSDVNADQYIPNFYFKTKETVTWLRN